MNFIQWNHIENRFVFIHFFISQKTVRIQSINKIIFFNNFFRLFYVVKCFYEIFDQLSIGQTFNVESQCFFVNDDDAFLMIFVLISIENIIFITIEKIVIIIEKIVIMIEKIVIKRIIVFLIWFSIIFIIWRIIVLIINRVVLIKKIINWIIKKIIS